MITIKKIDKSTAEEASILFGKIVDGLLPDLDEKNRQSYKSKYTKEALTIAAGKTGSINLIAADENGSIVGLMFGWEFQKVGHIHWIGVAQEHRKQGIARKITDNALEEFKRRSCYKADLFTYTDEKSAEGFFRKFGFVQSARIEENFCKVPVIRMDLHFREPEEGEDLTKIIIAGEAGHGIKLAGTILAKILSELDKNVTLNIVYGPSVRSGKMHAELIYSDRQISNPFIEEADILIMLSDTGDKFKAKKIIANKGIAIGEEFPFSDLAAGKFGSDRFINMLALGKLMKTIGVNIEKINIENNLPEIFVEKNLEAVQFGYTYRAGI
ncbi:MAG: GNAT family N-acetyltransferase [Candidatus Woesearchaeota archaeon]